MSGSTVDQTLQQRSDTEKVTRSLSSVTPSRTCLLVLCATILGVALGSCKRMAVGAQWAVVEREHKMATVRPIADSFWSVVERELTVLTVQQMAASLWATSCGALLLAVAAVALAAWCIYAESMQHITPEDANEAFAWDPLELTTGRSREVELGHMGLLAAWECCEKAVSSNCSTEAEATSEHSESSSEETLTFAELESTVDVRVVAPAVSRAEGLQRPVGSSTEEAAAAAKAEAVESTFHRSCRFEGSTKVHASPRAGVLSAAKGASEDHGDKIETQDEAAHGDKIDMQDKAEEEAQEEAEAEAEVEADEEEQEEKEKKQEPAVAMAKTAKANTAAASTHKLAAEDKEDEQVGSELTPAGKLSEPPGETTARPIMAISRYRLPSSSLGIRWSDCPSDDPAECEESSCSRSSASRNAQRPPGVWHQEQNGSELVAPVIQHNHSSAWLAYPAVPVIDYSLYGYPRAMPDPSALGHPYASQFFGTPMAQCRMPNSWGRTDKRQHGSAAAFSSTSAGASPRQNHGRAASQDSEGGGEDLPCKKSSVKNGMSMQEIMETLSGIEETRVVIARRIKQLGFKSGTQLRRHFQEQGAVEGVLVSHSHLQTRVRPASLAFAIMATEEGAKAVLAQGSEQVVAGVTITLNAFRRPSSTRDSQTGLEKDTGK